MMPERASWSGANRPCASLLCSVLVNSSGLAARNTLRLAFSGLTLALSAVGLCLPTFEKLRTWGAVLVGETNAKDRAQAAAAQEKLGSPTFIADVGRETSLLIGDLKVGDRVTFVLSLAWHPGL
jgi:hypothetical protein